MRSVTRWLDLGVLWLRSSLYLGRCHVGNWLLRTCLHVYPSGGVRRELIQSLHIWRSRLDMHMAINRRDPTLNYRNHYPEQVYEDTPAIARQRDQQRTAAKAAARRRQQRPKEDG